MESKEDVRKSNQSKADDGKRLTGLEWSYGARRRSNQSQQSQHSHRNQGSNQAVMNEMMAAVDELRQREAMAAEAKPVVSR